MHLMKIVRSTSTKCSDVFVLALVEETGEGDVNSPGTSALIYEVVSRLSWRYFIKNKRGGGEKGSGG